MSQVLGIDIGGSGVKGAPVALDAGELTSERLRIETPQPSSPEAIAETVASLTREFGWEGAIGCTFPGVVRSGVVATAANLEKSWIGTDAAALFSAATGCSVTVLNDADAAGIAEARFGAARGIDGVALVLTLGTGVGSALLTGGRLVPNTELGHVAFRGGPAERYVADSVRKQEELDWPAWSARLNEYLAYLSMLFWPEVFVIGGGVSKHSAEFIEFLNVAATVLPAGLLNNAGIVGAALAAAEG